MVDAAPFRALRYDTAVAGDPANTSAPAYSDLERFSYAEHRTASPYTVLELMVPDGQGSYRAARAAFERWRRTGVLVEDPRPAYFRYEQHELRHGIPTAQQGILAAVALEADGSRILPHEEVEPDRATHRLERLQAVPADVSPIFALYPDDSPALRALLAEPARTPPVAAFSDQAGIDHRVWRLADEEQIRTTLRDLPLVIADGHHRYASALAYRDMLLAAGASPDPSSAWTRTLMYLVGVTHEPVGGHPSGPELRPIHRLVRTWRPGAPGRLARDFVIEQVDGTLDTALAADGGTALGLRLPGGVSLVLRPRDHASLLARLPPGHSAAWRALDAALVDHAVLPQLGAGTVEARGDAIAAAAEVEAGRAVALFLLRPADARTVLELASQGERMPAKTTWFRPKPRAGLIMRALDPPVRLPLRVRAPTVGM